MVQRAVPRDHIRVIHPTNGKFPGLCLHSLGLPVQIALPAGPVPEGSSPDPASHIGAGWHALRPVSCKTMCVKRTQLSYNLYHERASLKFQDTDFLSTALLDWTAQVMPFRKMRSVSGLTREWVPVGMHIKICCTLSFSQMFISMKVYWLQI